MTENCFFFFWQVVQTFTTHPVAPLQYTITNHARKCDILLSKLFLSTRLLPESISLLYSIYSLTHHNCLPFTFLFHNFSCFFCFGFQRTKAQHFLAIRSENVAENLKFEVTYYSIILHYSIDFAVDVALETANLLSKYVLICSKLVLSVFRHVFLRGGSLSVAIGQILQSWQRLQVKVINLCNIVLCNFDVISQLLIYFATSFVFLQKT